MFFGLCAMAAARNYDMDFSGKNKILEQTRRKKNHQF